MRFWDGAKFTDDIVPDPVPTNGGTPLTDGAPSPNGATAATLPQDTVTPKTEDESNTPTATTEQPASEGSLIPRFVALLTPLIAVGAGWLAGAVANAVPGVTLDQNQVIAFMIAAVTAVLTAAWKWFQGWQAHEHRVALGQEAPRKAAPIPANTPQRPRA